MLKENQGEIFKESPKNLKIFAKSKENKFFV